MTFVDALTANYVMTAILVASVIALIWVFRIRGKTVGNVSKTFVMIGIFAIVGLLSWQMGLLSGIGLRGTTLSIDGNTDGGSGGDTVIATYQPTASYSVKDKFATTTVSGTSYYKQDGAPATTTQLSNVNPNDQIQYWMDNDTYWVQPVSNVVSGGVNYFSASAWLNGTATITGYDLVNRQSVGLGVYNTSMGANKQANIEYTYQGTAKKSAAPFGGVFVVEYNSTIPDVSCTSSALLSSNPYQLTWTVQSTSDTYKAYTFGPSLDDGTGSVQKITCQFNNGATAAGAGARYYAYFIPANYYVSQNGDILLDTEKSADASTTRTGIRNQPSLTTTYWGT